MPLHLDYLKMVRSLEKLTVFIKILESLAREDSVTGTEIFFSQHLIIQILEPMEEFILT